MSVWSERHLLDRCFELRKHGEIFPLAPGAHVARGFADVGYEEFCLLPGDKLVSLFSGELSELAESQRGFFFVVPSADAVRDEIDRRGWDITALESPDRRGWTVTARHAESGRTVTVAAPTILETLLDMLMKLVGSPQ